MVMQQDGFQQGGKTTGYEVAPDAKLSTMS